MGDNYNGLPFVWDDEVEDENLFRTPNLPASVQPQRIRLSSDSSDSDQEERSSSTQSSLLGLSLKKTPSFMNLLERTLSKGKQAAIAGEDDAVVNSKSIINENKFPKKQDDKMKASNFPAFFLNIGNWQKVTMYEGDLTVKVYYAKKKLVWEILDGPLKNKIEIQWANISAIRAHTPANEPGTLYIELENPPSFFREINPQPRKHTVWNPATDFTGGQAPIWRRHCVKFSPGVLDKHYEKLLVNDPRLLALSRNPFPSHSSPYFDTTMYRVSQLSLLLNNFEAGSSNPPPPTGQALLMPVEDTNVGTSSQLQQQIYQPGVMQQQFQFDQNELLQLSMQQAAVDEDVDQAMNSWLGMNPTTYYDGGNPNFFGQEFAVGPLHSLLPPPQPQPQLEALPDNFFQQHTHDYQVFPHQQESHNDFFPDHQLFPPPHQSQPQVGPQQEALQDFFPQPIMNYQPSSPQQEAQHEHMSTCQLFPPQPSSQQEGLHEYFPQNYQLQPQQQLMNFPVPPPPQQEPQYDFYPHHLNYQLPPPPQPQPHHPPQPPPHQYLVEDDASIFMRRSTNTNSYFTDNINPGSGPFF